MSMDNKVHPIDQAQHTYENDAKAKRVILVNTGGDIISPLVPETYDYIELSYSGNNITSSVFKVGGSGGTVVATLNLTYSGDNIISVERV